MTAVRTAEPATANQNGAVTQPGQCAADQRAGGVAPIEPSM